MMKAENQKQISRAAVLAFALSLLGLTACKTTDENARTPQSFAAPAPAAVTPWSYDPGPSTEPGTMGRALINLNSEIPNFPEISNGVLKDQKFRPAFGPMPWRMLQQPNSVKILFIGQDGTHIAEAAGRPATAGFGGRAMDLAKYFGVGPSAGFINTYAFTIKGQYGAFGTPFVSVGPNGEPVTVNFSGFTDNGTWLISQDSRSPIVQWRNGLIDWIIANNKDSLKLIVLFGGAARDAASSYVIARGGKVGPRIKEDMFQTVKVPEIEVVPAGGNNEFPVPYTKDGKDLYSLVLNKKPNYNKPQSGGDAPDVKAIQTAMKASTGAKWAKQMVFSNGGINESGMIDPAQLGGYDLDRKMVVTSGGSPTISLKGLKIPAIKADNQVVSPEFTIKHDILVAQLPHPTALSMMDKAAAAEAVGEGLKDFQPYVQSGWKIQADPGFTNSFAAGEDYAYARADMGPETYDFGAPASRMVNVSTASRLNSSTIIFGTRDKAKFDSAKLTAMENAKPSSYPAADEMWTTRPRGKQTRFVFDPGPGEKYARIMKENIPEELIESHAVNRDYAHYRGTFKSPKVLVLADPEGYDDLITARALTGTRGQYLHGLLTDAGYDDKYLVIKTAPFALEPADLKDWNNVFDDTKGYREAVLKAVLADSKPELILADGKYAQQEIVRILGNSQIPVVKVNRTANHSKDMIAAGDAIRALGGDFASMSAKGKMVDIPRSHLSYYARLWEGTSGDRVITSNETAYRGKAFAEVAPKWATTQKAQLSATDKKGIATLNGVLKDQGLRMGGESIRDFAKRIQ